MGIFERYLSIWVTICIIAGLVLGNLAPFTFRAIAQIEWAHVNLIIALLIWVMIYPMMVNVNFSALKDAGRKPKGLILTLIVNWLIKPFTMTGLAWIFFKVIFSDFVDPTTASEYIAGMILLGVAPCTAMVFVWSHLAKGDANYTLMQVSVNDIIMVFAFAPLTAFLLGVSDIHVPWEVLLTSVTLYILCPLVAGILTRKIFNTIQDPNSLDAFLLKLKPWSILGLLATVTLLFGFQAETIINEPIGILLISIPLIIQSYGIFSLSYFSARALRLPHSIAAPAGLIGTSNFFELAVAVAISLFGLHSGAALATVVGVLVEVPVMLSLVAIANQTKHWFPSPDSQQQLNRK